MLKSVSVCAALLFALAVFVDSAEARQGFGGARMGGFHGARMGGFHGARMGGWSGARMGGWSGARFAGPARMGIAGPGRFAGPGRVAWAGRGNWAGGRWAGNWNRGIGLFGRSAVERRWNRVAINHCLRQPIHFDVAFPGTMHFQN